mmetsp:Transcript_48964/g.119339  ORF Transcript_48964/g.119339 Transcript_48964/m.119339 type:complete len:205 (-) Transcript_48964:1227-1841(-)
MSQPSFGRGQASNALAMKERQFCARLRNTSTDRVSVPWRLQGARRTNGRSGMRTCRAPAAISDAARVPVRESRALGFSPSESVELPGERLRPGWGDRASARTLSSSKEAVGSGREKRRGRRNGVFFLKLKSCPKASFLGTSLRSSDTDASRMNAEYFHVSSLVNISSKFEVSRMSLAGGTMRGRSCFMRTLEKSTFLNHTCCLM